MKVSRLKNTANKSGKKKIKDSLTFNEIKSVN